MAETEVTAPRKRGRPPKKGGPAPRKPVVLDADGQPRKRGRPPKDGSESKKLKPAVLDASGQPRKRGRPPKNGAAEATKPEAAAIKSTSEPAKRRGRPPKAAVAEAAVVSDAQSTPARPRGRPKKTTTEADNAKVNGTPKATPGRGRGRPAANPLKKLLGSYAIECPYVSEEWPDQAHDMEVSITTTDIDPNGLIASFNLGIIEGTMLLATSEQALSRFQRKMEKSEDDHAEDESAEDDDEEPPLKKAKGAATDNSIRLYFVWRGQDCSTSEIHHGSSQIGSVDFLDDKAIQFRGVGSFPAMGSACKFTGTRYDHEVTKVPSPWSQFSPEKAEDANRARWL